LDSNRQWSRIGQKDARDRLRCLKVDSQAFDEASFAGDGNA
jgi:hypothetical protein